jgi:hypothetical protein
MNKYGEAVDRESAYEMIREEAEISAQQAALELERAKLERERAEFEKQKAIEAAKAEARRYLNDLNAIPEVTFQYEA